MIIASPKATFSLPEASRGIYAAAGGLARIVRICGLQIGSEIAMTGRVLSAAEAARYNVVNRVAASPETLIPEALEMASKVTALSPDAIIVTRAGLREAWETGSVERAAQKTEEKYGRALKDGENALRGLAAFKEKRKPEWVGSKL